MPPKLQIEVSHHCDGGFTARLVGDSRIKMFSGEFAEVIGAFLLTHAPRGRDGKWSEGSHPSLSAIGIINHVREGPPRRFTNPTQPELIIELEEQGQGFVAYLSSDTSVSASDVADEASAIGALIVKYAPTYEHAQWGGAQHPAFKEVIGVIHYEGSGPV